MDDVGVAVRISLTRCVSGLALAVACGLFSGMASPALATSPGCSSGSDLTVSTACTNDLTWSGGTFTVTSAGSIVTGTPLTSSATVGALTNAGTITASGTWPGGVYLNGATVAAIINQQGGTIAGGDLAAINLDGSGGIGVITNSGALSAGKYVILNQSGTIQSIANTSTGVLSGMTDRAHAIVNNESSTIGTIVNDGLIQSISTTPNTFPADANPVGILNYGAITSITNNGTIKTGGSLFGMGIQNTATDVNHTWASIQTLTNTGTISTNSNYTNAALSSGSPYTVAIENTYGTIGTLDNSGTVTATGYGGANAYGVENYGTITTLTNSGTVAAIADEGTAYGILNRAAGSIRPVATLTSVTNSGTISSDDYGIYNLGRIGRLSNSGIISGKTYALYSTGTIGDIVNTGTIKGNIYTGANALSFAGGSGDTYGTLTGYDNTVGTITAASASAITLASGNMVLNDNVVFSSGGTLTNRATTRVNNALRVTGNYTQTATGALVIGVASTTNYGRLTVSGTANLDNGTATLVPVSGHQFAAGQSYTIVSAGDLSAAGFAATVTGFSNSVQTKNGNLIVTVDGWSSKVPSPVGGSSLGTALDILATQNSDFQSMLSRLSQLSPSQQATGVQQLGVSQLTPQVNVGGTTIVPTTNAIQQRQLTLLDGQSGVAAGSQPLANGLWGQVLAGYASRQSTAGADGYGSGSYGLMFGADTHMTDDLALGLAASWLHSRSRGRAGSIANETRLDSYQVTAYGTWRPQAGPAYVEGLAGVGLNRYDQDRGIDFLGVVAGADYGGSQYQAKIGAGYDIPVGKVTVTPLGSMQFARLANDSYSESGAGAANLLVRSLSFNSVESELGARAQAETDSGLGLLRGDVRAAWVHDFTESPISTSAVIGGVGFVSTTARPSSDGARLSAGVELQPTDQVTVRAEYDAEIRSDYVSHTGLARVRYEF